ncbi:MAG: sigma-54-dependent Fis family transcriptional regulator [Deltaproteobacteria bacterium]|nr:sigma-54-dependent Fis family transcriptional regulator [Deltaproteobacteria bacterium]
MSRILVVEDEPIIRSELRRLLVRSGHEVAEAATVAEAAEVGPLNYDLVITDLRLPGAQGTDLIGMALGTPVIIMTSFATVKSAVEAMKLGAVDYVSKPFDPDELLITVDRVIREARMARQNAALRSDVERTFNVDGIVGASEAMRRIMDRVERVAPTDATVLVLGESGTGKELIARAIHARSRRKDAPFVAVNCAAIPEGLIESELFGHEKGAFTGASRHHEGLVESAHGGTLFLDEVGELPPSAQARLLRVLQESEVRQVGSNKTRKVDVRVIAATHRDLPELVRAGAFREDLYFRLRVLDIRLPPLRERPEDLPQLADHLLAKACHKVGRSGLSLSPEALAAMAAHPWPGNVREMENAIERAVILADDLVIDVELLGLERLQTEHVHLDEAPTDGEDGEETTTLDLSLEDYFRQFVLQHQHELSETDLAKRLGISRKALWERRQKLGIPRR